MADVKLSYPSASDVTITLNSLASDSNLLAGRQSAAIDNSSNKYLDYLVSGKVAVATSGTLTAARIQVWAVGSWDGTSWPNSAVFTGSDAAATPTTANHKNAICRFLAEMATDTTNSRVYDFGPVSLAAAFGGICPVKWLVYIVHSTGQNLASSGNQIRIQPVYETVS